MATSPSIPGEVLLRTILYQGQISQRVIDVLTDALDEAGVEISGQQLRVLIMLRGRGALHLSSLAAQLGVTRSTMTRQVDNLVAKGLVRRVQAPHDGRALHLELEPVAYRAVDTAISVAGSMAGTVFEGFVLDDIERLRAVFGKLDDNLSS